MQLNKINKSFCLNTSSYNNSLRTTNKINSLVMNDNKKILKVLNL